MIKIITALGMLLVLASCGANIVSSRNQSIEETIFTSLPNKDVNYMGTAYLENDKIISSGEDKFLSFLHFNGIEYVVRLVHLKEGKVVEDVVLDKVYDNHGGGSIALNRENKVCAIYNGHQKNLKYKCSKNKLSLSSWEDTRLINDGDSILTYPTFTFDENSTLHLLYRKATSWEKSTNLAYLKIYNDDIDDKEIKYLHTTDSKYSNFSATLVNNEGNFKILFKDYGHKFNGVKFNKGVYLYDITLDKKVSFLEGADDNLEKNSYVSNLVLNKGSLVFNILNYTYPHDFFRLYFVDNDFKVKKEINLIPILEEHINFVAEKISPYIMMARNKHGELFLLFSTVDIDESKWDSLSNKLYYFKYTEENNGLSLIYKDRDPSWIANLEKDSSDKIPDIIYTNNRDDTVSYKHF